MNLRRRIEKIEQDQRPDKNQTFLAYSKEVADALVEKYAQKGVYINRILIVKPIKKTAGIEDLEIGDL